MVISELDEVLFWQDINVITNEGKRLIGLYYPNHPERYFEEKKRFYLSVIKNREIFLNRISHYEKNGKPKWITGRTEYCDDLSYEQLMKAFNNATAQNGALKAELSESGEKKWASHIGYYQNRVLPDSQNHILELTVGAGFGTAAIARKMSENDFLTSVDIDFKCAKTADGIGKHYQKNVLGLCGNLWNLPFDDSCFSVVCSHLGIDECRFVGKIISEAVRVLKTNGRLVLTCRTSGYLRHKELFDLFGFTCHESESILNRVNLYTNINQLDKIMARLNCTKTAYKDFGVRFVAEYTKMSLAQKQ